jgi:diguanylate cyclase (GGDEF)-like protein
MAAGKHFLRNRWANIGNLLPARNDGRRDFILKTALPVLVSAIVVAAAVFVLLLWSREQTDQIAVERQERLVALVVSQMQTRIAHDQESVTVWDDAVTAVKAKGRDEWIDVNLGTWMHTYFGHDGAYVLDPNDRAIFAFSGGAVEEAESGYARVQASVYPLVAELRARLVRGGSEGIDERILSPGVAELAVVDGHPAIISVKPIISDSGDIVQTAGQEYMHVAVRLLDGSFIEEMRRDYLFEGLHFSWQHKDTANEASFALTSATGKRYGSFVWQPYRPGSAVFSYLAPILGAALLAVFAIIAVLMAVLRRRSIRLQASQVEIRHLALHDPLTGLPNRSLFNERLEQALAEAMRRGTRLAVLYLDLDRFKQVNDTLGHSAGDQLIREFGGRLKRLTRTADVVSRIGGDEFTIILTDIQQAEDVDRFCERAIESVRRAFEIDGNHVFVGVSIGVSHAPDDGLEGTELTRKADIALYHAKGTGRSRYAVFGKNMDAIIQERRKIEHDLRNALQSSDQIRVHYQPLYSASSREITGVEALLRWHHPERGWIGPDTFIPVAEETGLMEALGQRVLREACGAANGWPIKTLAVNVSAIELRNPGFAARVSHTLLSTGMEARRLELEVTESALTDNSGHCEQNVRALRELGVRIALDDFGTGFSSLGRLQQLDVDRIKIDRRFVQGCGRSGDDEAIVQAIVDLAHAKGLRITAEGVETQEQSEYLRKIGCDELQGFLLSRPVSTADIDRIFGIAASQPDAMRASVA